MKGQKVYTETSCNNLTREQKSRVIKSRWVLRLKTKGQHGPSTDRCERLHRRCQRQRRYLCLNTDLLCFATLANTSIVNNWIARTGDISTAFRHAKAATEDLFMFPPAEFYNPEDQVLWKLNKAIYGLRSSPKAWQNHLAETLQQLGHGMFGQRTQRLQNSNRRRLRFVLRGRPPLPGRSCSSQHTLQQHSAATPVTPNRRSHSRQHRQLSGAKHLQQGRLLRDQFGRQLHYNRPSQRSRHAKLQRSTSTWHESSKQWDGTTSHQGATFSIPACSRQTAVDDIHKTGYQLRNEGIGKVSNRTYNASDQQKLKHLLRYIKGTQHYKLYARPTVQSNGHNTRHRRVSGQRLGRLFNNKEVNNGIRDQVHGFNNTLR